MAIWYCFEGEKAVDTGRGKTSKDTSDQFDHPVEIHFEIL